VPPTVIPLKVTGWKGTSRFSNYKNNAFKALKKAVEGRTVPQEAYDEVKADINELFLLNNRCVDYFSRERAKEGCFYCGGVLGCGCPNPKHVLKLYWYAEDRKELPIYECDHKVEQQEIQRCLVKACTNIPSGKKVASHIFYRYLCGYDNIELVHRSCHDKKTRPQMKIDQKEWHCDI
jgi:DNA fragmentation factor 40 kDa